MLEFLSSSISAEVHGAPVPDLRFEAVPAAVGFKRGVYGRHQLLLPHFNGHQLPAGKSTPTSHTAFTNRMLVALQI